MLPNIAIIILTLVIQPNLISGAVPVGFKSILKCKEYNTATYEHPSTSAFKTSTRNQPAKLSKYPFTAIAVNVEDNTYCGGTLISDRFILVTAGCAHNKTVEVILESDFKLTNTIIRHAVKRQIKHPDFKSKQSYNDIGLLELDKPVTFSEHLRPACIKTSRARDDGEVDWFLTAWLQPEYRSEFRLVRIPGSEINNEKCQDVSQDERRLPYGIIGHLQICIVERKYQSVYDWDGELPMTLMTRNKQYESYAVIGIPTEEIQIATNITPQAYTRISGYIGWLESVVWPEEPISGCNKFIFDRNI